MTDINKLKEIKDLALKDTYEYVLAASELDLNDEEENFTKSNHYRNAGMCLGIVAKIETLLSKIKIVESDTSVKDKEILDKVNKAQETLNKIKTSTKDDKKKQSVVFIKR